MISFIREECLSYGWLTEEELLNFIAVAESTPGPIAVNMAAFVGSTQAGLSGAFLATLGVVLPSFTVILIIAALIRNLLKYPIVKTILDGIQPVMVGLILATAITMFLNLFFNVETMQSSFSFNWKGMIIFTALALLSFGWKKRKKNRFLLSGIFGVLLYGA